ncbi:sulfotransferase domain-containing protein [Phenylobacterium aquaticum]|uniref:sulfotransferase domain-containing protein n=1 Tax=Phenylobacterium aquaticum TaxID=1763816 RepID=UPI001F5D1590|nr:sulfotransferase domain-containing protein [Phenylobacterium aquaticum]MCI3134245.1 sulfotransferase domain-containing protein [Phenylobacterium aquaticum]
MKPLVQFIVIGAQKAGTTALFDYMGDMPGLSLSRTKEVHFFDDESVDWSAPDYGAYHAQFDAEAPGLKGEATPIYVYWPRSLERIKAYNPQMRLILMLRDPVERAWSHWRMEFARGAETQAFSWCIREGRQRLFEGEPWGHHREFSYVERGFYGEQVERLFSLFPRNQVLTVGAEALQSEPASVLGRIAGFLGAPAPPAVRSRRIHVGREFAGLTPEDVAYLRRLYDRDAARLKALTGWSPEDPAV